MTDEELITLLRERAVDDWTAAEIALLRERWPQSAALRAELLATLHLETLLGTEFAPKTVTFDALMERAARQRRERQRSQWIGWLIGLSLLLTIGLAGGGWWWLRPKNIPNTAIPEDLAQRPIEPAATPTDGESAPEMAAVETPVTAGENSPPASNPTENAEPNRQPPGRVDIARGEPWSEALSPDLPPWPNTSPRLTADFKTAGHDSLSEAELKRWLTSVPGKSLAISQESHHQRRFTRVVGHARLRAPWPEQALLRMTPLETDDFTLHFWNGQQGVALKLFARRDPHQWAAFRCQRANEQELPDKPEWSLLTTDSGAYHRAGAGQFDVRVEKGMLVLARGPAALLAVPFAGLPTEVYLEGTTRLRGFSMARAEALPLPSAPPSDEQAVVFGKQPPAKWDWQSPADRPAMVQHDEQGGVSLTSTAARHWTTAYVPLPRAGLFEVIARIETEDPGTGIYFGNSQGEPTQLLGLFLDQRSRRPTFGLLRPGEQRHVADYDGKGFVPPYFQSGTWLRMVTGLGTAQLWSSGDGLRWGHIGEQPYRDLPGRAASIGLFTLPGETPRTIRIQSCQVREITSLQGRANPDLCRRVPDFPETALQQPNTWKDAAEKALPQGVDPAAWLDACAYVTLARGSASRDLNRRLLEQIAESVTNSESPLARKVQTLTDAAAVLDWWDDPDAQRLAAQWRQLAEQLPPDEPPQTLTQLRAEFFRHGAWSPSRLLGLFDQTETDRIIRAAILGQWTTAVARAREWQYFNLAAHPDLKVAGPSEFAERLARWVRGAAVGLVPESELGITPPLPVAWRHPLQYQFNKDAYNVRTELQAALAGQAFEDACRIVNAYEGDESAGLVPDFEDRALYVAFHVAVGSAMRATPEFARTMTAKFGPLGLVRLQQAVNETNLAQVRLITRQFFGTDAAWQAHRWLGDLRLADGDFISAESEYRAAIDRVPSAPQLPLLQRMRLAMALAGRNPTALPAALQTNDDVTLDTQRYTAAEWEALLASLRTRSGPEETNRAAVSPVTSLPTPPAPQGWQLQARRAFDANPGTNAGRYEFRRGDAYGRQLAVDQDDRFVYVNNRFQLNAYDRDLNPRWAVGLGAEQGDAYECPFVPMHVLCIGDRLYWRRISKAGAELLCIRRDDGQILWKDRPRRHVITDPVLWNGAIVAVTTQRLEEELVQLELARWEPVTGELLSIAPLLKLSYTWPHQLPYQLTLAGRTAIVTAEGTVLCFNDLGELRWMRRQVWLPPQVDDLTEDYRVHPPLVVGETVISAQPGVRAVTCLAIDTGRLVWETPVARLQGILGANDQTVMAVTPTAVVALDAQTGKVRWERPAPARLEATGLSGDRLLVSHREPTDGPQTRPIFSWWDLATGAVRDRQPIEAAPREEFQLGPLFHVNGRWWSFAGQSWKEVNRDLVELTPFGQ